MPLLHIRPLFASFLCPLLFAFLLPVAAAAQEDSADGPDPAHTNAVQFYLLGGAGASFIMPLSERTVLRFQVGADLTAESSDGTETTSVRDGDSAVYIDERNLGTAGTSYVALEFSSMALRYIRLGRSTFGFVGGGPLVGYERKTQTWTTLKADSGGILTKFSESTSAERDLSAGVRGVVGVETFITPFLSVLGETQISVTRQWRNRSVETRGLAPGNPVSETESDRSGWWYDIVLARLGMAIHF